eukprot:CAMPEP_0198541148 /NCGR_PEP_ID=MMETSP1462-20131121/53593_1 /TAXON_ID=1333877 /ORGANISM="Brandtodinium nutriculum, Strain RCC3387" /LENGTH=142 /DNA_ID=CAMNT_0044271299 /DNA_START=57 /DNA_END=485 /DNA_ORIENTATION=+
MAVAVSQWGRADLYSEDTRTVTVKLEGTPENVVIHPVHGPVVITGEGSRDYVTRHSSGMLMKTPQFTNNPKWLQMSKTEREVLVHVVAKRNRRTRETAKAKGPPPSGAWWLEPQSSIMRANRIDDHDQAPADDLGLAAALGK